MNLIKEQKTNIAMIVMLLLAAVTFSLSVQASGHEGLGSLNIKHTQSINR